MEFQPHDSSAYQLSQIYSLINIHHTHIESSIINSQATIVLQKSGM